MQGRGVVKPPTGITFDCDFGDSIDSLLTLVLLEAMSAKGETRLLSTSISKANLKAAQAAEAVISFMKGAPAPVTGSPIGGNPEMIGLATNGKLKEDTAVLNAVLDKKGANGAPAYPWKIARVTDTAECSVTMRNILLAQNDLNAIVLVDGPATNAVQLMELYGARPQLVAKVKYLVFAAGAYPNGTAESGIRNDIAAARKLFAEWPTPIITVGTEVGEALPYPAASIEKDFSWATPSHPLVDAYRAYRNMPYDAPSPGLAAALYAAHPDDGYFKLSEPGTVTVQDDGKTRFTTGANGKHRYLIADPAQKEKIVKLYTDFISAKPVPRTNGFGRGGRGASGAGGRGASGAAGRGPVAGGRGASGATSLAITPAPAQQ